MDIKKIILLAGALIVAGITAFVARGMFASGNAPEANAQIAQQQQGVEVLVATRTMPVGTIVHNVELKFGGQSSEGHYDITPYAFHPKVGHKLVANDYVELGQGILDCLADIHERLHKDTHKHVEGDWLVVDDSSRV